MAGVQSTGRSLPHSRWNDVCFQQEVVKVFDDSASNKATKTAHQLFPYVPLRTFQLLPRWKRHYDMFGESPAATQPVLGKRFGKKRGRKGKIRLGHLRLLKEIVEENPAWYLDEISDEFHRRNQDDLI